MAHSDLVLFLLQLAVMLGTALGAGTLMRRLGQQALLGELLGGIILGPTIFGYLFPESSAMLFPPTGNASIARDAVVKLGLLFFMFAAGMEISFSGLRQRRRAITYASIFGILVPFVLGALMVLAMPNFWGQQAKGNKLIFAMFMGTALSISALPVIIRTLIDCNLLKSSLGLTIVAAATINDLIGWALFGLLLSYVSPHYDPSIGVALNFLLVVVIFTFALTVGRKLGQQALLYSRQHLNGHGGFLAIGAFLVLLAGAGAEALGVHAVFGAFLLGVTLAPNDQVIETNRNTLLEVSTSFLGAPLYFVSVGLKVNFLHYFDLTLVALVLLVACLGKIVGATFGGRLGGMDKHEALALGFGLNARGAMEMILATIALDFGLIDQRIFVALIVTAIATSIMSGPAMKMIMKLEQTS